MKLHTLALDKYRVMVCLGPGGVGKTTVSAALALRGACARRAVDVMTVDPAPRLLDALGLQGEAAEPVHVALDGCAPPAAQGRLRALKLDPKRTFDHLVARYAPSDSARAAILENRLYRNLSQALAGVGDYMAMEKLLELSRDPITELVVLDTPPARQALDFLDAPRRLLELLNSRAATLLGASRGFLGQRLGFVDLAARAVLSAFDRLTGLHLLSDVQAFVRSFDGMYQGFAERAEQAQRLLRSAECLMVLVTTAEGRRIDETRLFVESLAQAGLEVGALIVNRVLPEMPESAALDGAGLKPALRRKCRRNWQDFAALKAGETRSRAMLRAAVPEGTVLLLARDLGRQPRTLADLAEIGRELGPV